MKAYISAAHSALLYHHHPLFNYFFLESDYPVVKQTLTNLHDRLNGLGPPITIKCAKPGEVPSQCFFLNRIAFAVYHGYQGTGIGPDGNALSEEAVVGLCPVFWSYPILPDPCDRRALQLEDRKPGNSQALILLHEMLHAPRITGSDVWAIHDLKIDPVECHELAQLGQTGAMANVSATANVNNFALFAQWAWMQAEQRKRCPDKWPLFRILEDTTVADADELRRLLEATQDGGYDGKEDASACEASFDECATWLEPQNETSVVGNDPGGLGREVTR